MWKSGFIRNKAVVAFVLLSARAFSPAWGEEYGHPTLEEFKEEVQRADLIVRGSVEEIVNETHWGDNDDTQMMKVKVDRIFKGRLRRPEIVVTSRYWETENKRHAGDDVILLLKRLQPLAGDPRPFDQTCHFVALSYCRYCIKNGKVFSATGMAEDLAAFRNGGKFVTLIEETVAARENRGRKRRNRSEYDLGRVLFSDNFDDGSMSGWTLLKGARRHTPEDGAYGFVPGREIWMAEGISWKNDYFDQAGTIGRLNRDRFGRLIGERNSTQIQIGVYGGRLRLRSNHLWQHATILAGNPNWTDYQVDVDMFDRLDKEIYEPRGIAHEDYKTFGVFGRVTVPNLPNTKGEHCEIGVEFGSYSNMDATTDNVNRDTIQIRLKTPDADGGRDWATCIRKTKILDFQTYEVPKDRPIHVSAKFLGNRVEGWIDGKKYVEGTIPASNASQFERGRIGLWVFETFAEFDNIKVTELVRQEAGR